MDDLTKAKQSPQDFDQRAKQKSDEVGKIHEFRRENIKELEPPINDFFEYDP